MDSQALENTTHEATVHPMRKLVAMTLTGVVLLCLTLTWILLTDNLGRGIAEGFTGPFLSAWQSLGKLGSRTWGRIASPNTARDRILELELRLCNAEIKLAETEELRQQLLQLRQLVGLQPPAGWRITIADIIARDPIRWNQGFRINRGTAHGLGLGNAVLAANTIIGRITECRRKTATVTTVAASICRISVVLAGSRQTGVLWGEGARTWRGKPRCAIHFLPKDVRVSPGELVWTSGFGNDMPGGLIIGRVAGTLGKPDCKIVDSVQAVVGVCPTAEFDSIRHVAVLSQAAGP